MPRIKVWKQIIQAEAGAWRGVGSQGFAPGHPRGKARTGNPPRQPFIRVQGLRFEKFRAWSLGCAIVVQDLGGKSVVFLLSGLFCCLGCWGVIFCCLGGDVLFFVVFPVWAGAQAPPKQQKTKNTHPPKQQKHKHDPAPSERVFFCCLGGWSLFFAVWAGACSFFAVWAGGVFFFFLAVWAGCVIFFAVWAGGVYFSLLFGRGTGVHSLTGLPGSSLSDPTTKKTKQQKRKKTGSGFRVEGLVQNLRGLGLKGFGG